MINKTPHPHLTEKAGVNEAVWALTEVTQQVPGFEKGHITQAGCQKASQKTRSLKHVQKGGRSWLREQRTEQRGTLLLLPIGIV